MSKRIIELKKQTSKLSVLSVAESAFLPSILKHLQDREAFKDADPNNNERMYYGDVFSAILGEIDQTNETSNFNFVGKETDTYKELEMWNKISVCDYILVTMH